MLNALQNVTDKFYYASYTALSEPFSVMGSVLVKFGPARVTFLPRMNSSLVSRGRRAALLVMSLAIAPRGDAQSMAARLQPFVDSHTLPGAVALVANRERILRLEAVGFADVASRKPMQVGNLFWIASMSKPITAAGLMMLVDEGLVKLDDPVEHYLPEFKGQMVVVEKDANHVLLRRPKHPITIRNLLSHTSGLSFKSGIEEPTLDLSPLATRVRSYAMMPLEFEPDSKYQYANAGINTVGRIIEVVAGVPYEVFLDRQLFQPLGMTDTTFRPAPAQIARLAKSYKGNKDKSDLDETPIHQLKYPLDDPAREPMPAGGLFSTATDVAHFCQMILNDGVFAGRRYLSEAAVKQMTSRQTAESTGHSYGLGFQTNGVTFGHAGAYSTNMSIDSKRGSITVFMVQNAGWRTTEGKKIHPAFHQAAIEIFGK